MKQPVHTRFAVVTVAITAVLLTRGVWLALVILTLGTFFAAFQSIWHSCKLHVLVQHADMCNSLLDK